MAYLLDAYQPYAPIYRETTGDFRQVLGPSQQYDPIGRTIPLGGGRLDYEDMVPMAQQAQTQTSSGTDAVSLGDQTYNYYANNENVFHQHDVNITNVINNGPRYTGREGILVMLNTITISQAWLWNYLTVESGLREWIEGWLRSTIAGYFEFCES